MYLVGFSEKMFNLLQGKIKWDDVKLTSKQNSNITLAMLVLERCRHWTLLTSELALFNASLEPTYPDDGSDLPVDFL